MPGKWQKRWFMARKFWQDIRRKPDIYPIAEDLTSPRLGDYYFVFTETKLRTGYSQKFHFDEQGIPMIPAYIDVQEQGLVYYPISIGQYGLAIWNSYLNSGSEEDARRFLNIADWFMEHRIDDQVLGSYWLTHVDKPAYGIKAPWKSAFAQARGINILLRAHQLTGREDYQQVAEKALWPFLYTVEEGGVVAIAPEGPFYEEYPAKEPVLVLNGMIFALWGIWDYLRVFPGHPLAEQIFEKGLTTLKRILPRYDMGFWSKYSLCQMDSHPEVDPSTIFYQYLHAQQLEIMYRITGEEIFREFSERWRGYVNLKNILKMYRLKYDALKKMKRLE